MKKLFILLNAMALLLSGASQVSACGKNQSDTVFNIWNLSTWDTKQKAIIVKSYLASVKKWYNPTTSTTWGAWVGNLSDDTALDNAFDLINGGFNTVLVVYGYRHPPANGSDLKNDLAQGVLLDMKARPTEAFTGELSMTIKGDI